MRMTHLYTVTTVILLLCLAACSREGQPIEQVKHTKVNLNAFSKDTLRLRVMVNETLLTESLPSPGNGGDIPVEYYNARNRFRVYNVFGNALLLDTLIDYKPGFLNGITFFQPSSGANMVWIGPPVNEPLPDPGYLKLSIIYTFDPLPDAVRVVVENSVDGGDVYAPTDSFTLKKGEFSRYFTGRNTARKPDLKFYTTAGPRKLLASARRVNFNANPDFTIYVFNTSSSGNATDGFGLDPVKLY